MTDRDKKVLEYLDSLPSREFTNRHGEVFSVRTDGIAVWVSGDELNKMIDEKDRVAGKYIQLFNPLFNIWSAEEQYLLGEALQILNSGAVE